MHTRRVFLVGLNQRPGWPLVLAEGEALQATSLLTKIMAQPEVFPNLYFCCL